MTRDGRANPDTVQRILVIKLSALGDVFQALGPVKAIRDHYPDAHLTVLTTAPYNALITATGYTDEVWLDSRPKWYQPLKLAQLRRLLRSGNFDMVFDLQTSDRSSTYFRMFSSDRRPLWSGIAPGCSHPHANPDRNSMHTIERQSEQLTMAGIPDTPFPDTSWSDDLTCEGMPRQPYALLVPGGAPHRPDKRWPARHYADLAIHLSEHSILPVLLGTTSESEALARISDLCPKTLNLCGKTSILDLVPLAKSAVVSIGNDTGPMHVTAIAGCPSVVLYSHASDPALCAQRGPNVEILRRPTLTGLPVSDVVAAIQRVTGRVPHEVGTEAVTPSA